MGQPGGPGGSFRPRLGRVREMMVMVTITAIAVKMSIGRSIDKFGVRV